MNDSDRIVKILGLVVLGGVALCGILGTCVFFLLIALQYSGALGGG